MRHACPTALVRRGCRERSTHDGRAEVWEGAAESSHGDKGGGRVFYSGNIIALRIRHSPHSARDRRDSDCESAPHVPAHDEGVSPELS